MKYEETSLISLLNFFKMSAAFHTVGLENDLLKISKFWVELSQSSIIQIQEQNM